MVELFFNFFHQLLVISILFGYTFYCAFKQILKSNIYRKIENIEKYYSKNIIRQHIPQV